MRPNHGWPPQLLKRHTAPVVACGPNPKALLSKAQARLVIGGEVSLWGEEINEVNLASKAWPRSSAFSERMWSARNGTKDVTDAGLRLVRMYCKLAARGIGASPISPGSCNMVHVA